MGAPSGIIEKFDG